MITINYPHEIILGEDIRYSIERFLYRSKISSKAKVKLVEGIPSIWEKFPEKNR